ncbi:hypothetical protein D0S45_20295 [Marinifilum sp. JC120]|nr:hypothetical protein D0S45_20295 [Marinifilum sp. JC120]
MYKLLVRFRNFCSSLAITSGFFLVYLQEQNPVSSKFSDLYPQNEFAGIIFVSIYSIFGYLTDSSRNDGFDKEEDKKFASDNPFYVLFGVYSFLTFPFVLGQYVGLIKIDSWFLIFKSMILISSFVSIFCMYIFRKSFLRFVAEVVPLRCKLKNISFYLFSLFCIVVILLMNIDYYCIDIFSEYNNRSNSLSYMLYLVMYFVICFVACVIFNFVNWMERRAHGNSK